MFTTVAAELGNESGGLVKHFCIKSHDRQLGYLGGRAWAKGDWAFREQDNDMTSAANLRSGESGSVLGYGQYYIEKHLA